MRRTRRGSTRNGMRQRFIIHFHDVSLADLKAIGDELNPFGGRSVSIHILRGSHRFSSLLLGFEVMTIFPRACPSSRYRSASVAPNKTLSMDQFKCPALCLEAVIDDDDPAFLEQGDVLGQREKLARAVRGDDDVRVVLTEHSAGREAKGEVSDAKVRGR